jgi:hypothetical protein
MCQENAQKVVATKVGKQDQTESVVYFSDLSKRHRSECLLVDLQAHPVHISTQGHSLVIVLLIVTSFYSYISFFSSSLSLLSFIFLPFVDFGRVPMSASPHIGLPALDRATIGKRDRPSALTLDPKALSDGEVQYQQPKSNDNPNTRQVQKHAVFHVSRIC